MPDTLKLINLTVWIFMYEPVTFCTTTFLYYEHHSFAMQIEVISVGGSILFPDAVDVDFLRRFKRLLTGFKDRKFIIVTGGGRIARLYIDALRKGHLSKRMLSNAGIAITRVNAKFMASFFMKKDYPVPKTLKEIENLLKRHNVVFCGSLRYEEDNTSDGTAAEIARHFGGRFINMTNVKGLYTKDPRKFRDAEFVSQMSFDDFHRLVNKMNYIPGQHFVLDQRAAAVIKKSRITTFIIGNSVDNLSALLHGKKFFGTVIGY